MKPSWSFILSSLYCSRAAASTAAHVFLFDPVGASPAPQAVPVAPETARLILAQRLGVSQFHSIDNPSEDAIQQLNQYGGRQSRLFGEHTAKTSKPDSSTLVWLEDVEDVKAIIPDSQSYTGLFTIPNPPPPSDNDRLVQHFGLQADSLPKKADPLALTYTTNIETELLFKPLKDIDIHNDYLAVFRANKNDKLPASELAKALNALVAASKQAGEKGWPITIVVMPPSSNKNTKRTAQPYGTYSLPSIARPREQPEAILSPLASSPSAMPPIPDVPDLESFPKVSSVEDKKPAGNTSRVLGILPVCFDTLSHCEASTNGCSGHGKCSRKNKAPSDNRKDCYACVCEPTRQTIEHGGMEESFKTTYWGGPACQKKDVSVPFFLFAGVGVALAFLIAGGIGLLYSMGSEELPSVIGAGVSGPAKK